MPVDGVSTPSNANFSNIDGTETHEGGDSSSTTGTQGKDCPGAFDNMMNETGDYADSIRDWIKGDASGRDVWDAAKQLGGAINDTIDNCTNDPKETGLNPVLDPMLPPGYM
jgi:hypothetical protein